MVKNGLEPRRLRRGTRLRLGANRERLFRPWAPYAAVLFAALVFATPTAAQDFLAGQPEQELSGEGWMGFADVEFMLHAVLILTLAALLGAAIAYHPRTRRVVDTIEEAEAPKVYITYSVVGAIIGIMVVQFGLVVGFVVFGIGGLIRFRTMLPSATNTGRLIYVTLLGLSAGLDLPHLAVLGTAFGFALIYVLDSRVTYRIEVKGLDEHDVADAAHAYREALKRSGFRIINQSRSLSKGRVTVIFQTSHKTKRREIHEAFNQSVPEKLKGTIDWEVI